MCCEFIISVTRKYVILFLWPDLHLTLSEKHFLSVDLIFLLIIFNHINFLTTEYVDRSVEVPLLPTRREREIRVKVLRIYLWFGPNWQSQYVSHYFIYLTTIYKIYSTTKTLQGLYRWSLLKDFYTIRRSYKLRNCFLLFQFNGISFNYILFPPLKFE